MLAQAKLVAGLAVAVAAAAVAAAPTQAGAVPAAIAAAAAEPPVFAATPARSYDTFDANQGIAVDRKHFYVVDNQRVTKHDKATGRPLLQFAGAEDGPIVHLDSGVVVNDKLYAAHSNRQISDPNQTTWRILGPGQFEE
jgi:hypothetical protein